MHLKDALLLEIIDKLPIAVFAKDPKDDYKFVIWNAKMAQLFGIPQQQILDTTDFDLFEDIEEAKNFRKMDEEVIANGETIDIEEIVSTVHGQRTCHTLKLPLRLQDGRQLLVGIIDDITEDSENKKQLEAYRNDLELLVEKRTQQLQNLANIDSLTTLGNRNYFLTELKKYLQDRSSADKFAVMFIDLNGFKLLNDSYGHRLGDELLCMVGQRLKEFDSQAPIVARLGGDEFVLIVNSGCTNKLATIAQGIYDAISKPFVLRGQNFQISCAIGISIWPENGDKATLLLQSADMAMYNVKHQKSAVLNYQFYDAEMLALSQRKLELEQSLRNAIDNNELYLVLQPQFAIASDSELYGAEVLLRWQSKKFGFVSPVEFIPIAEKSDLILSISAWVLDQSCQLLKKLQSRFEHIPRISINLSGREINAGIAKRLNGFIEQYKLSAQYFALEITEAQVVSFSDDIISELDLLRQQGFKISLDDFGTGYSSMSYLSSLEFDEIKIDRSFITKICSDKKTLLLVRAIVSMAQALESKVVAEGVETTEELDYLQQMGIDSIQGYLLGKPMSYDEFAANIDAGKFRVSSTNS